MANKKNIDLVKTVFYVTMVLSFLYIIGYGIVTNNSPFDNLVFNNSKHTFSDFWDCVRDNVQMKPYQNGSSYPAIACLFFTFIAKMIPITGEILAKTESVVNPMNQIVFYLYSIVSITIFISLLNRYKAGGSFEKLLSTIIILLSAPFIYMFERGNIIFLALILLMIFAYGKDSKNKWVREISYMCLGLSAALKIYPAVFGLLLIKDKNYKAAARTVIYGIILFVVPFYMYGGMSDIKLMFANIKVANDVFKAVTGVGGKINMVPTITVILGLCGIDHISQGTEKIISVLPYIYMLLAVIACMFHKSNWKVMTLLVSIIILVPGFSYIYTLVFFVIPIISFLDSEEKRTWIDWSCLVCFLAIMVPIVHDLPKVFLKFQASFPYIFSTFVQGIGVLLVSAILIIEGFAYSIADIKKIITKVK